MKKKIYFTNGLNRDFNYNHTNEHIHNSLLQKVDDEQLEGSGFMLNGIVNVILAI